MHLAGRSALPIVGTLVWALIILLLSAWPGERLPKVEWLFAPDKFAHAGAYGILAAGIFFSWRAWPPPNNRRYYGAFFLAAGYGLLMEGMQYWFFPGRYFEFWDIVANISGALIALLILKRIIIY